MAAIKPIEDTQGPVTPEQLRDMIQDVHLCVHNNMQETSKIRHSLANHRMEVVRQFRKHGERIARVEGYQQATNTRLAIPADNPQKVTPAWFPRPWQIAIAAIGSGVSVTTLIVLYRIFAPVLIASAPALHKAIMNVSM